MHSYLRAIGFSKIKNKKKLSEIIHHVMEAPDSKKITEINEDINFAEISKEFYEGIGLSLVGDYDEDNKFVMDYYYPYFKGKGITTNEEVVVEKHAEKESYAGICDEIKVGVSLIFYLQNTIDYLNELRLGSLPKQNVSTTLSGLSISGKILFPIDKSEKQIQSTREADINRKHLIAAARQGDEDAIESLTLEDIDMYTLISRKIMHEDVFSLVDSYFMPYGIECDQYSVLGEILDLKLIQNSFTKEELYLLKVECNDLVFDICMNKEDLLGEPAVGRRFKGTVWMQGRINFPE